MMKYITFLIFFSALFNCAPKKVNDNKAKINFIKCKYRGDIDKPIPICIFSSKDSILVNEIEMEKLFKVDDNDLQAIEGVIKSYSEKNDDSINSYYQFIVSADSISSYFTTKKNNTIKVFDQIISKISDLNKRDSISQFLQVIIKRLPEKSKF